MDFKILFVLLLILGYTTCDPLEDANSPYFELKSPYTLNFVPQSSTIIDATPNDLLIDYTNFEAFEKPKDQISESQSYLYKEENGALRELLSSPIIPLLKSDMNLKKQLLLGQFGSKNWNEKIKSKNYFGKGLPAKGSSRRTHEAKLKGIFLQGLPSKKDNTLPQVSPKINTEMNLPRKRGKCCIMGPLGRCFPCDKDPLEKRDTNNEHLLNEFALLPMSIVNISSTITKDKNVCDTFNTQLYETDLAEFPQLTPNWLLRVHYLGMCPYTLRKRYLGPNTIPSQVIEARCLCKDAVCSKYGGNFRCTAVQYPIQTRVLDSQTGTINWDLESVTAACVCAQKPSAFAENGNKYFVGDNF